MIFWKRSRFISLYLILLILATLLVLVANNIDYNQIITASVEDISDNWTVIIGENTAENVNVSSFDIGVINEGDQVILSKVLGDITTDGLCLSYYTTHSISEVYIEDELIYSYGEDFYEIQRMVPKKHHYVPLSGDYSGKNIKIVLNGARKAAFSSIRPILLGERAEILRFELVNAWIAVFVGLFLFTLGILLIILSPYLFLYHNRDMRILFSGLISLMLAMYILAFNGIIDLFIDNALLNNVLEYASLYNIPTAIVGFLMSISTEKEKKSFLTIFILDVVLFIVSIVLHFSYIARFSDFTGVLQVITGIECVFVIVVLCKSFVYSNDDNSNNHSYSSENIFILGLVVFMILSVIDIIRYNLAKYSIISGNPHNSITGFTIGALLFVLSLLVSYFFYNIYSSNIDSMQSKIINIAYIDALTGLSNRARCDQMLTMLSEEHGTYCIINLDLNKLKQVNDTLGHHEGDRLLTGFATILSDAFWDANLIGRMGGDEFMVILMEDRAFNVSKRIHELYSLINDWNNKEQAFKYSASYGYAYSNEVPNGSAKEVYMLADARMYEMKKEHHNSEDEEVI